MKGIEERGRPRVTSMKNIKEWLGHTYNGCVKSGRSEQLEIHDSRPTTTSRWHLMMMTCRWFLIKKKKKERKKERNVAGRNAPN